MTHWSASSSTPGQEQNKHHQGNRVISGQARLENTTRHEESVSENVFDKFGDPTQRKHFKDATRREEQLQKNSWDEPVQLTHNEHPDSIARYKAAEDDLHGQESKNSAGREDHGMFLRPEDLLDMMKARRQDLRDLAHREDEILQARRDDLRDLAMREKFLMQAFHETMSTEAQRRDQKSTCDSW